MLLQNFIELCMSIIRCHHVDITTNYSIPIEPFMYAFAPEKVSSFVISFHPEGRSYGEPEEN